LPIDHSREVPERGKYDAILSYHHLQTIPQDKVNDVLRDIKYRLKEDGEVHFFVPSLEWAGKQILNRKNNIHPLLRDHLWNNGKNQNGFRLYDLRNILGKHFAITHATAGEYTGEHGGNTYSAGQYYLRGEAK
jgi:hypothetical protein